MSEYDNGFKRAQRAYDNQSPPEDPEPDMEAITGPAQSVMDLISELIDIKVDIEVERAVEHLSPGAGGIRISDSRPDRIANICKVLDEYFQGWTIERDKQ